MEKIRIKAESRETGKKGVLNRMRKAGNIPAILYGRGSPPVGLVLNMKELTHAMKGGGINAVLELDLGEAKKGLLVMLKEFQIDSISRHITHVDLLKIDLKQKVTVNIPLHITGKSVGVEKGGVVDQPRRELEVRCLPGNIPEKIDIDITLLDMGDSIHVNDLKLPEGVEAPHDVNFAIVSIVAPRAEEPEAAAAPAVEPGAVPATEVSVPTKEEVAEKEKAAKPEKEKGK